MHIYSAIYSPLSYCLLVLASFISFLLLGPYVMESCTLHGKGVVAHLFLLFLQMQIMTGIVIDTTITMTSVVTTVETMMEQSSPHVYPSINYSDK